MKVIGAVLSILISANTWAATLKDVGVHVAIAPGNYSVKAGQTIEIPVTIVVDHPELATDGDVELYFWSYLPDHGGANSPKLIFNVVESGKILALPGKLFFATTGAMMGDYPLKGHVSDLIEWDDILTEDDHVTVHVDNTVTQADLAGPVFSNIQIKKSYHVGEKIEIEVTAKDKSGICLDESTSPNCKGLDTAGSLAIICKTAGNICLDDDMDGYISSGGKITDLGNGRYRISLNVSAPQKTGKFGLEVWNFMDIWGNQENGVSNPIFFQVVP